MKTLSIIMMMLFSFATIGTAQTKEKEATAGNHTYMVMTPHTDAQCLNALTELKAKGGDKILNKFSWGCSAGDHTGYAMLQASSSDEVRKMLATQGQKDAKIVQVEKFSSAQIESFHKKMAN